MRKLLSLITIILILFSAGFATDRLVLVEYFTNAG